MSRKILVGSMNGKIYIYDTVTQELDAYDQPDNKGIMGLARHEEHLFVSSREMVMRQAFPHDADNSVRKEFPTDSPQFHQLLLHGKKVYITCTAINEIWVFDYDLKLLERKRIVPPNPKSPIALKSNYNHANSICYHNGLFYVGLNWLTSTQYGKSGVCVFNQNLEEQERFEYGWETHGFTFVDGKPYALCATSDPVDKKINHPHLAGLMFDNQLVFQHPIDVFCKAFVVDSDRIFIFGGEVATRTKRGNICGMVYILDRNFNLLNTIRFNNTGQFCGAMLI